MQTKHQQKVAAVLREIDNYRSIIKSEREYILEYEHEIAQIHDEMRYLAPSTPRKLRNKRELKELAECVRACNGSINRSERWIKRIMRNLSD